MAFEKVCRWCNKEFLAKRRDYNYCTNTHYNTCVICNKEFIITRPYTKDTCSRECTNIKKYGVKNPMQSKEVKDKVRKTNLERYGVEHALQNKAIHDKFKSTMVDRYGVEHPSQSEELQQKLEYQTLYKYGVRNVFQSSEIKDKIKETNLLKYRVENPMQSDDIKNKVVETSRKNYGVDHYLQSEEVITKRIETVQERYGVDNVFQLDEVKSKMKETSLLKYGVDHPMKSEEVRKSVRDTCIEKYGTPSYITSDDYIEKTVETCMEKYGVPYPCMTRQCLEAQGSPISSINRQYHDDLSQLGLSPELEHNVENYLYDIKIGNILIEIDPTYTHSSLSNSTMKVIPNNYHMNKTKTAVETGYRCIHIFDWDDKNKLLSLLNPNKKQIYARNCVVKELDKDTTIEFLDNYHLQGSTRHYKNNIYLGLYYEDSLVLVMTFGKPRYNKNYECELLRLCSHEDYRVIGGASKVFKYFQRTYRPSSIISYCDLAKFTGDVYKTLGFRHSYNTEPRPVWSKYRERITDNLLNQRGYDQLFGTNYGKGTSNKELMLESGWSLVYDCGQAVYVID